MYVPLSQSRLAVMTKVISDPDIVNQGTALHLNKVNVSVTRIVMHPKGKEWLHLLCLIG